MQWLKVRHLHAAAIAWFAGADHLAGTFEIGVQGKDDAEWAIKFNALIFDSFMFATGNFKDWIIGPKATFTTQVNARRSISSSSITSVPMELSIYNYSV